MDGVRQNSQCPTVPSSVFHHSDQPVNYEEQRQMRAHIINGIQKKREQTYFVRNQIISGVCLDQHTFKRDKKLFKKSR